MPDATVSISVENGPIVVQPPTNNTPELAVKRTMKRKAYVLVPAAPYRLDQGSHSHQRSQTNSSTSALLVTRDKPQPTVNRPERRVLPSKVNGKVSKAPTIASTPSLSDIGISVPTTVRKPGSFIIHTPHVTQSIEHLVEPVNPRTFRPLHIANPVAAQSITKKPITALKFNKLKVQPASLSSINSPIMASTDTQGGRKSPNLPQSQPAPLPEVALNEVTAQSIADKVIDKLVSNYIFIYLNDG